MDGKEEAGEENTAGAEESGEEEGEGTGWRRRERREKEREKREKRIAELKGEVDAEAKKRAKSESQLAEIRGDEAEQDIDEGILRRRRLGKDAVPEPSLELVLPDELQDSLRLLKPEGNLLADRYRNMLIRGRMETRKAIQQPKKKRRKVTEKWTHKDFEVPV